MKKEKDSSRINCNSFSPVSLLTRILIRSLCNDHPRTATLKRNLTSFAETTSAYLNRILGDAASLFFNLYLNLRDFLCMCNETVISVSPLKNFSITRKSICPSQKKLKNCTHLNLFYRKAKRKKKHTWKLYHYVAVLQTSDLKPFPLFARLRRF